MTYLNQDKAGITDLTQKLPDIAYLNQEKRELLTSAGKKARITGLNQERAGISYLNQEKRKND